MDCVRVNDAPRVEKLAQQHRRTRAAATKTPCRGTWPHQVMSVWACSADARRDRRHQLDLHSLDESLEPAKLQARAGTPRLLFRVVELDVDLGVALDTCDGIDGDCAAHRRVPSSEIQRRSKNVGFCRNTGDAIAYA